MQGTSFPTPPHRFASTTAAYRQGTQDHSNRWYSNDLDVRDEQMMQPASSARHPLGAQHHQDRLPGQTHAIVGLSLLRHEAWPRTKHPVSGFSLAQSTRFRGTTHCAAQGIGSGSVQVHSLERGAGGAVERTRSEGTAFWHALWSPRLPSFGDGVKNVVAGARPT